MNDLAIAWEHGVEYYYHHNNPDVLLAIPFYDGSDLADAFYRGYADGDNFEAEKPDLPWPTNPYLDPGE